MRWPRREAVDLSGGPHGPSPSCSERSKYSFPPSLPPGEGAAGPDALAAVAVDRRDGWSGRSPRRAADGQQSTPRGERPGCGGWRSRRGPDAGSTPRSVEIRNRVGSPPRGDVGTSHPGRGDATGPSGDGNRKVPTSPREAGVFFARRCRSTRGVSAGPLSAGTGRVGAVEGRSRARHPPESPGRRGPGRSRPPPLAAPGSLPDPEASFRTSSPSSRPSA